MSIERVALIFDDRSRPETTGVYCRRALGQIVEVEHFLPTEVSRIPRTGFDLYLNIDDGYRNRLPADLRPAAWWAIDTHMDLEWYLTKGPDFEHVFVAQRDGAMALQQAGMNASWLPLACDPEIHAPHEVAQQYDVAFVGNVTPDRQAWLDLIRSQFPNTWVARCYFDEMARTYSASRIVFNRGVRNDVNMRVFEALGCGAFLLTNGIEANGLEELFAIGRELAVYDSPEELLEKIRHSLDHPQERQQIARAGRAAVLARHTYLHRMRTVLETCGRSAPLTISVSGAQALQDRTYYEFPRPEVVALVPPDSSRILDIGCGGGRLGATLKARQPCHVTGLELDSAAARLAGGRLDHVMHGNIESDAIEFPEASFDCVICADVLEHLHQPQRALEKIRRWLSPQGALITSIPNVRHHTVVTSLIEGNWTYEPAGLLDNTHLRFFTRREIEKLLFRSGFEAGEWQFVPGASYEEWAGQADQRELHVGKLNIAGLEPADAQEFHAYQYLIRTRLGAMPEAGLTSIILVTHNQVELTRDCLKSLRRFTDEPIEILVVDNGSTDDTVEYLRTQPDVRLIANADNRGFGAAVNQGIAAAQGSQFLLLNNDVVLTTGWLRRMLDALGRNPEAGLVGPCTNCTAGPQRVGPYPYRLRTLDDLAWRRAQRHAGQIQVVPELTGFCLLIRRAVVDQIGGFDERFGIHCFEDVDFCRRATAAGFQAIIALDVYIHHYGHRSYSGAGLDQDELAREGEKLFRSKWRLPASEESRASSPRRTDAALGTRSNEIAPWLERVIRSIPQGTADLLVIGESGTVVATGLDAAGIRFRQARWEQLESSNTRYDCIIACGIADAAHPAARLAILRQRLRPDGRLIADFPNTRHHDVVSGLLEGAWSCEPVGETSSLDPIRFLTRREVERLLDRSGFELDTLESISGEGHEEWLASGSKDRVDLGRVRIAGLTTEQAGEFFIAGFVTCSRPRPIKSYGLTSIILVTHNEVEYTRRCLDSIAWRTDEPYEVIVVDNGSTDSTVPYLRSLSGVTLITNAENRGFPAAVNQGLKAADGDHVLLLNNDTVATTGWLRRMLDVFDQDANIGLVGPCSNRVSGEQQIPITYESLADLDGFAWDWCKTHRGELFDTDRLVGFCLLIRRHVLDRIGGMDERFGIGCYEDDDFCRRALAAGFRAVVARDAFVHHFGSRTFAGSGVDLGRVLEENRAKYEAKWTPGPSAKPTQKHSTWSLVVSQEGGLQLVPHKVRLSLCMIVRDNEGTIRPCLESIRPWVDEMIVVDTGSNDRTPEICRELGAQIYQFPWCDDFSAARNESLRHATGEWLFWMDSDDTISPDCARKLRELALGPHEDNVQGYVVQVHCPAPAEAGPEDLTVVDHVKLFRNHPQLRFEGRIHEQIIPAIRRLGGDVAWTDLYVTHSGADHSPPTRARKLERDFRLLSLELKEKPDHPFVLFNFGMTHLDAEQFTEAVRYLKRYLEVADPGESTYRKGYALLVAALCRLDDFAAAKEICEKGLKIFPEDKELLFRNGVILHQIGKLVEAEQSYLRVLTETTERHFTSVDRAISGYKARHNLALVYEDAHSWEQAADQWRLITGEVPAYGPAWAGLGRALLKLGRLQDAKDLSSRLQSVHQLRATGFILSAHCHESAGSVDQAEHILNQLYRGGDQTPELLRELARLRFGLGNPAAAVAPLERLAQLVPDDPAAQHNLAVAYLQAGRPREAAVAGRRSVTLRPQSEGTWALLAQSLQESGQFDEAQAALNRARGIHLAGADLQPSTSIAAMRGQVQEEPACVI